MFNKKISSFLGFRKGSTRLPASLTGLILLFSFASGNANAIVANSAEIGVTPQAHQQLQTKSLSPSQISQSRAITNRAIGQLSDGVYLYGQSSVPEQIGQEYMVFEVRNGRAIGAFYMPQSEFNCFAGTLQGQQLNVTLAPTATDDIAEGGTEDNSQGFQPVAAASSSNGSNIDAVTFPVAVKLQNYHRITRVSGNDHQILSMCKANSQ